MVCIFPIGSVVRRQYGLLGSGDVHLCCWSVVELLTRRSLMVADVCACNILLSIVSLWTVLLFMRPCFPNSWIVASLCTHIPL